MADDARPVRRWKNVRHYDEPGLGQDRNVYDPVIPRPSQIPLRDRLMEPPAAFH